MSAALASVSGISIRGWGLSDPLNASGGRNTSVGGSSGREVVAAQQLVARFGVLPEVRDRMGDVADERDRRVLRQIVGERGGALEEERKVVLDPARHHAVAHVLVERRAQRVAFEHFAVAAAKARAARLVDGKFAGRQQADFGDRVERSLRVGVERLDALDVVAEEVEPVRQRAAHRVEIDQPAAHAELSRRDDLRHVLVARERELRAQRVDVEPRALLEEERERRQVVGRRQPIERRGRRDDQHVALAARDVIQRREALRNQILVRREVIVRQRLPVGQQHDLSSRREPRQLVGDALRGERVGGDDDEQALLGRADFGELRERERIGGFEKGRGADLAARLWQSRDERGQRGEHRSGRCGGGSRGRGGGDIARCGGRGVGRRPGGRSRLPDGEIGLGHVQLQIERGLYAGRVR